MTTTTTAMTARELEALFRSDAAALGAEREVEEVFAELRAAYEDPSRRYHSIEHIAECLALLTHERASLTAPSEVAMAIWFHDAIYATHPLASSEERSAKLARTACARMGIAEGPAERIAAMVRATKYHELPGGTVGVNELAALTLFDVDLAVLGADPVRYARYERDVRAEYSWVPDGVFRSKRGKLLRDFAARPAIYRTPRLRERLEARARKNLGRAVAELRANDDELVLHATDDHLFVTRAARLEAVHPWPSLYYASILPALGRTGPKLGVAFSPIDDGALQIALDAPSAAEVVDRVRSIPDYDADAERRALTTGVPGIVYSRERHHAVTGPLRANDRAAYR